MLLLLSGLLGFCASFIQQPVTFSSRAVPSFYHPQVSSSTEQQNSGGDSATEGNTVVVVISPPGGVGQVAAVQAASQGASVRWFVVNEQTSKTAVNLEPFALEQISRAGGSLQVAGAAVNDLLLSREDPLSALPAVSTWCQQATTASKLSALICTTDGSEAVELVDAAGRRISRDAVEQKRAQWRNAMKVAAQEAGKVIVGTKVAVLSTEDDEEISTNEAEEMEEKGVGGLVGNLMGKIQNKVSVPDTLTQALSSERIVVLRHGQLFGIPESSPEFSPLVGGPRRTPELTPEYTFRTVRLDPTAIVASRRRPRTVASSMGSYASPDTATTQSSRHAVGDAAALMALGKVPIMPGLDVCISSLTGTDEMTLEMWQKEFARVVAQQEEMQASASATVLGGGQPVLFSTEFGSVPDVSRLADWLATKWAPAVLRTYDIASIRVGERPVYANRVPVPPGNEGKNVAAMEIVWQQLVDFQSATVGKMIVQVDEEGMVATRGPGDSTKGFGTVSRRPLAGEDVLIRRLAEAASQAVEKGLAKKMTAAATTIPTVPEPEPITAAATVPVPTPPVSPSSSAEQGPRQSGAKRSTERARGAKRKNDSDASTSNE